MTLLDALAGTWEGPGEGHYPTIDPFGYHERLTFDRLPGKPILAYAQRTWHAVTDEPLHTEAGYVRVDGPRVELVIAQPTGFAEVHHAVDDGGTCAFGITALGHTASALDVATVRRQWVVGGDLLIVDLWMTYAGVIDGHHLRSQLRRTG